MLRLMKRVRTYEWSEGLDVRVVIETCYGDKGATVKSQDIELKFDDSGLTYSARDVMAMAKEAQELAKSDRFM